MRCIGQDDGTDEVRRAKTDARRVLKDELLYNSRNGGWGGGEVMSSWQARAEVSKIKGWLAACQVGSRQVQPLSNLRMGVSDFQERASPMQQIRSTYDRGPGNRDKWLLQPQSVILTMNVRGHNDSQWWGWVEIKSEYDRVLLRLGELEDASGACSHHSGSTRVPTEAYTFDQGCKRYPTRETI